MGIRRLIPTLRPYAERSPIGGQEKEAVIIDGPALVHHIFGLWVTANQPRSILNLPTTRWLCETTFACLDELSSCGITVAKIYFDAYLPSDKHPVRIERFTKDTSTWTAYYWAFSKSIASPAPSTSRSTESITLFPGAITSATPRPEFLGLPVFAVPAVIEALSSSPLYSPVVQRVPGEADWYCADFAASNPGSYTILTSDSDLLAHHPLGANTAIVFLNDLTHATPGPNGGLIVLKFKPSRIEDRLGVSVCRLAFELSSSPGASLSHCIQRASHASQQDAYLQFSRHYQTSAGDDGEEAIPFPPEVVAHLHMLDTRTSEWFLRCTISGSYTTDYIPARVPVFLPSLHDCPVRPSAWNACEHIRRLSYGLVGSQFDTGRKTVAEYRRLQPSSTSGGRLLDIPQESSIEQLSSELLSTLSSFTPSNHSSSGGGYTPGLIVFSIFLDCKYSLGLEKVSVSCLVLQKMATSMQTPDVTSWDFLHFAALVDATYYSLRMLKQVIEILSATGHEPKVDIEDMKARLETLPSLADISSLFQLAEDMMILDVADIFARLSDLLGTHDMFTMPKPTMKSEKKSSKPHRVKGDKAMKDSVKVDADGSRPSRSSVKKSRRSLSNNLFDVLRRVE